MDYKEAMLPTDRRLPALRSIGIVLVSTMGISVAGLYAVRHLVPLAALRPSNDTVGNYLQTVGTVYAVLLAFVVYVVWGQLNDARAAVDREANEILDLMRSARGLPKPQRRRIEDGLQRYVATVLEREWPAMSHRSEAEFELGQEILEEIWRSVCAYDPPGERERIYFAEILARFNDLSDNRTSRLSAARTRIPYALRLLLYLGAFTTIASMYLFAVDDLHIHALLTAALAGAIAHVLYVIFDLDDGFTGDFRIPKEPFYRLQRYIAAAGANGDLAGATTPGSTTAAAAGAASSPTRELGDG